MTLLLTLILAFTYSILASKFIKKHAMAHYVVTFLISVLQIGVLFLPTPITSPLLREIVRAFTSGIVGSSLLIVVMFTGALDTSSMIARKLRSIRKELSIMGSYLILFHILCYTVSFIPKFFTLSMQWQWVTISGLLATMLLVPLLITSYNRVRQALPRGMWKKIQRWSYLFYFLVYAHMVIANISEHAINVEKVSVYTLVFIIYTLCRLNIYRTKARKKRP